MSYRLEEVPIMVHLVYHPQRYSGEDFTATDRGSSHNTNPIDTEAKRLDAERAWGDMPDGNEKLMLYLVCVEERTVSSAAGHLGLHFGTAKRALARGLQQMHHLLGQPAEVSV